MPRFAVTTIGEGQLRYSVPAGTRLEQAGQLSVHAVCTEANIAGLLAQLGWDCGWITSLPASPLGRRVVHEFGPTGLDLSAVVWRNSGRLATYYVEYAVPPRPTQVYFDRANTCFTQLTPDEIDWDYLLDTRLVHLSGLTLPLSSGVSQIIREAARRAKQSGAALSLDVNYRARVWSPEKAAAALRPLIEQVDILFCSRGDAARLFGIQGDPEQVVRQLGEISPASAIVTSLAGEGLIGWDRQTLQHEPARPVTILDRIGAGDAMVAGVLHGWLQGDFFKGLRYGALTAALALSQYGDLVVTNSRELETLLEASAGDIQR